MLESKFYKGSIGGMVRTWKPNINVVNVHPAYVKTSTGKNVASVAKYGQLTSFFQRFHDTGNFGAGSADLAGKTTTG